jgi:hypothetical protein
MRDELERSFRAGEIGEREKEQAEDAREEIHILGRIAHDWHRLVDAAIKFFKTFEKSAGPTAVQIKGDSIMGFAILPGATGTFGLTLTPPTSVLPMSSVITWTADNSADVSVPVPSTATATQPVGVECSFTSSTAPVATSFNISVTVAFVDPVSLQQVNLTAGPANVVLGTGVVTPPPVAGPTAVAITQIS